MIIKKKFLSIVVVSLCLIFTQDLQKVYANNIIFEDDFSSGLEKWENTRGNNQYWSMIDDHLEAHIPRPYTIVELIPKNDYWDSSWIDISYQLDFTPVKGVDRNISFRYQDSDNWQEIHIVGSIGHWLKAKDGVAEFEKGFAFNLNEGTVNYLEFQLRADTLIIFLNGEKIFEGIDPTWNGIGGKIGLKAGTGAVYPTSIYFDNVQVELLDDIDDGRKLDFTQFKQSNSQWAHEEYDSASVWSNSPSIYHWGCALSSLASILNYHGITQLPDQTPMNPANLNTWLKQQPDGYIGQGLVNWITATRLTYLMSSILDTPKLEYGVNLSPTLLTYIDQIDQSQPFILQIQNHFFSGYGYTADQSDIHTKDPINERKLLSQYPQIVSLRTFTPSQTDLSYILVSTKSTINLTVKNSSEQNIQVQHFTERLQDDVDSMHKQTSLYHLYLIPKPETDVYTFELSSNSTINTDLTMIAYDTAANPSLLNQQLEISPEGIQLFLNFHKNGPSTLESGSSFTQFRTTLQDLRADNQLKKEYAFQKIDRIAAFAEASTTENMPRYKHLLATYLDSYHFSMTQTAYQTLLNLLNTLPF